MTKVAVITGGGSGMGLEVAKLLEKNQKVIITGRTVAKLENAVAELQAAGVDAQAFACDVSDRASVEELANHAAQQGDIQIVINAAGVSPNMTDAAKIFSINAVGTVNVNEVFGQKMGDGGVILNVASMAGHMIPAEQVPVQLYQAALMGPDALAAGAQQMLAALPEDQAAGASYSISKNFVMWYTRQMAVKLGTRGIRVVSISPGTFSTPMGEIEGEQAAGIAMSGALGRVGDPIEIARMMAFMVSDQASYLTGTDVLYDGGVIAAMEVRAAQQA